MSFFSRPLFAPILVLAVLLLLSSSVNAALEDWVDTILDISEPRPTCVDVGVDTVLSCTEICRLVGDELSSGNYRSVNGETICLCTTIEACSDLPTCEQLRIRPGTVEQDCTNLCGPSALVSTKDDLILPGDISAGNKDLTTIDVMCMCDGDIKCDNSIEFSDVAFLEGCQESGITSGQECDDRCTQFSFDSGSFAGGSGECTCTLDGEDGGTSISCSDAKKNSKETDPCGLLKGEECEVDESTANNGGGGNGNGSSSSSNSNSSSSSRRWNAVMTLVAGLSISLVSSNGMELWL